MSSDARKVVAKLCGVRKIMDYHCYKRAVKGRAGKPVNRWMYYWYDGTGKMNQKACKGCRNRSEAENYVRSLPPPETKAAPVPPKASAAPIPTIRDIAAKMFVPGSTHVDRRYQLGKSVKIETLVDSRYYIDAIVADWGDCPITDIDPVAIMDNLFETKRSGSWKNRYVYILKEILMEASQLGYKVPIPPFPKFALNVKKTDVFTSAELSALYKPENFPTFQHFVFFLLILSGGLRLGEARAVRLKQIIFEKKILIVDGFCKQNGSGRSTTRKGRRSSPS